MKITKEQLDILNSFSVTRLNEDESLLREVSAFKNCKNENLVEYLVGDAFDDDDKNRCACYVVRTEDGEEDGEGIFLGADHSLTRCNAAHCERGWDGLTRIFF